MRPDPRIVDRLVQAVVTAVRPLRIILFGSAARGEMRPDSDVDVLVVMPHGTHRRKTAQRLYRQMVGLGIPFDIVVATPEDLELHRGNPGLIYGTILSEGKEVYAS
ncbi:MAG: nucleotidyltransferase domain-containing protein [Chloroflexi bacterium]|nr:nucleotidyltransferase domain-containing protein [Chloroflexota bacterium]